MPHVFTLEGAQFADPVDVIVNYPSNGSPLAPHGDPIGPPPVPTPVFGPGGTPVMYRRDFPNRGPVCDYCEPEVFVSLGDASRQRRVTTHRRVVRKRGLGDAGTYLEQKTPAVANTIVIGGSVVAGAILAGLSVWILRKVGHREMKLQKK